MRHQPSRALLAAFLCAVGLFVTGIVAFHWPLVRARDAASLAGFVALSAHPRLHGVASLVAHSVDPLPYAIAALVLAAIALVRRRVLTAVVVPLAMAGAVVSAELLKPIVATVRHSDWFGPHHQIAAASWPSGHATAAMMLGLCAVISVPAAARPVAALLGCGLAIAVSYSILVLRWHFPSDILGGYLVAALWVSLVLAVLWWGAQHWPARDSEAQAALGVASLFLPLAVGGLALGGGFGLLVVRTDLSATYTRAHASLLIGAALIALLAAFLTATLATVLRPLAPATRAGGGAQAPTVAPRRPLRRARV